MSINFKNLFNSLEEYEYNLAIFEGTLQDTPVQNRESLTGFLEIFQSINNASGDSSKIKEFKQRIITLQNLFDTNDEIIDLMDLDFTDAELAFIKPKYLGKPKDLWDLAKEVNNDDQRAGLMLFADDFTYRSILGDGHCCFRAISTGLLGHVNNHPKAAQQIVANVKKLDEKLGQRLETLFQFLKSSSVKADKIAAARFSNEFDDGIDKSVENFMNDKFLSNQLMQLLRDIAVDYERTADDDFLQDAAADGKLKDEYLKGMAKGTFGGAPELLALERTLGLKIDVLATDSSGLNGTQIITPADGDRHESCDIYILRRGIHYEFAARK